MRLLQASLSNWQSLGLNPGVFSSNTGGRVCLALGLTAVLLTLHPMLLPRGDPAAPGQAAEDEMGADVEADRRAGADGHVVHVLSGPGEWPGQKVRVLRGSWSCFSSRLGSR